jgi:hypothetical protein
MKETVVSGSSAVALIPALHCTPHKEGHTHEIRYKACCCTLYLDPANWLAGAVLQYPSMPAHEDFLLAWQQVARRHYGTHSPSIALIYVARLEINI